MADDEESLFPGSYTKRDSSLRSEAVTELAADCKLVECIAVFLLASLFPLTRCAASEATRSELSRLSTE
jgi:hypothetical protein